jgi:hypothetical protein
MRFWRAFWVADHLRHPIAVTDIQEDQAAVIAPPVYPTGQLYLLANLLFT